ncbi:MAG: PH domain-containing protein [Candidatus Oceanisphaera merdipullorum]|nr:PH domain-containing protein [Candidatus Oceanisphaera merdipullorum]
MATVYKSKIDSLLIAVLISAIVLCIYVSVTVLSSGSSATWWVILIVVSLGIGLPLWLLVGTRYTLDSKLLLVQSGPFKWRIPVVEITNITPTKDPLSSPALSLDRLRIDYGRSNMLMISPRDKERFLKDLEALRCGAV